MWKFLFITFLLFFLLFRVGGFFLRVFLGSMYKKAAREQQAKREERGGKVNVDPNAGQKKIPSGYKGGEYIDYEEVD